MYTIALAACAPNDGRTVLTVYSPHGKELLEYLEKGFEKAHPEIDVQWVDMGSQEVLDRLRGARDGMAFSSDFSTGRVRALGRDLS